MSARLALLALALLAHETVSYKGAASMRFAMRDYARMPVAMSSRRPSGGERAPRASFGRDRDDRRPARGGESEGSPRGERRFGDERASTSERAPGRSAGRFGAERSPAAFGRDGDGGGFGRGGGGGGGGGGGEFRPQRSAGGGDGGRFGGGAGRRFEGGDGGRAAAPRFGGERSPAGRSDGAGFGRSGGGEGAPRFGGGAGRTGGPEGASRFGGGAGRSEGASRFGGERSPAGRGESAGFGGERSGRSEGASRFGGERSGRGESAGFGRSGGGEGASRFGGERSGRSESASRFGGERSGRGESAGFGRSGGGEGASRFGGERGSRFGGETSRAAAPSGFATRTGGSWQPPAPASAPSASFRATAADETDDDDDDDVRVGDGGEPALAESDEDSWDAERAAAGLPSRRPAADAPSGSDGYFGGGELAAAAPADFVFGISPVLAALGAKRRTPGTLYVQDSLAPKARRDASDLARALALAKAASVRVVRVDKGELNNMAANRPHQGLLLTASALPELRLDALPPAAPGTAPVWLALDEVQDPQNLGALLRSAHFLGAAGVVVSAKNSAPLSAATSKASAGAMEVTPVHATSNLIRLLARARAGGWRVVGAALGAPGTTIDSAALRLEGPTVLVLGNEGKGLRALVRRECDLFAAIPRGLAVALGADADADAGDDDADDDEDGAADGGGARDTVDSLNVSVAGAILLHQLLVVGRAAV
jgi:21S rRNA (GM2251-2'-O)-methyltransferase